MRLFRRRGAEPPEPTWRIGPPRQPTDSEKWLISELAQRNTGASVDWVDQLAVSDMNDGGMGSLTLHPDGVFIPWEDRVVGAQRAAEIRLRDLDGTIVSAQLNLDAQGQPFELDVWKIDFSRTIGDYRTMERIDEWQPE
jgi:hypothetical protein